MASGGRSITLWDKADDETGELKGKARTFANWVSREPGAKYPAESGRYHLYVSYACPWAHRTLIARKLKGLEEVVSFSSVHWHLGEQGWRFPTARDGDGDGQNVVPDPIEGHEAFTHLGQVYLESNVAYNGRFSVPVLYDKVTRRIVNNESSEILRMLGTEFDDLLPVDRQQVRLWPAHLQTKIDEAHAWIYNDINSGVYKSGFATTQSAYEKNVGALFKALDRAEAHLGRRRQKEDADGPYWFGSAITEVDIRLFVTLVRFDPVYVQHFKCNVRDIRSGYPCLHKWMRHLYWTVPAFRETTNFAHIKKHYTKSHKQINPLSISPVGPVPDMLPLDGEVAAVTWARRDEDAHGFHCGTD